MEIMLPLWPHDVFVAALVATVLSLFLALFTVRSFPRRKVTKTSRDFEHLSWSSAPVANAVSVKDIVDSLPESVTNPVVVEDKSVGLSMMEQLVPEIRTHALSYLDYPSLCRLSMTSSLMRKAANDDNAWKALYQKDFSVEQDSVTPVNGWKAYYSATRAIVHVNTVFFNIIRERSLPDMAQCWLKADYVKSIHASGENFSGYNRVMQSWQLCFNWEQGLDFQVGDLQIRVTPYMAWVTMKAYLNHGGGPSLITNVFEFHNDRWYIVHHHCSVMLVDGVEQHDAVHG